MMIGGQQSRPKMKTKQEFHDLYSFSSRADEKDFMRFVARQFTDIHIQLANLDRRLTVAHGKL
jgi:DNA polymerase III epsilon subunit-like protein